MFENKRMTALVSLEDQKLLADVSVVNRRLLEAGAKLKSFHKIFLQYDCHIICRAIAHHLPQLLVEDGFYLSFRLDTTQTPPDAEMGQTLHSWLRTKNGSIIDPYPVGLVTTHPLLLPQAIKTVESLAGQYVPRQAVRGKVVTALLLRQAQELADAEKRLASFPSKTA